MRKLYIDVNVNTIYPVLLIKTFLLLINEMFDDHLILSTPTNSIDIITKKIDFNKLYMTDEEWKIIEEKRTFIKDLTYQRVELAELKREFFDEWKAEVYDVVQRSGRPATKEIMDHAKELKSAWDSAEADREELRQEADKLRDEIQEMIKKDAERNR